MVTVSSLYHFVVRFDGFLNTFFVKNRGRGVVEGKRKGEVSGNLDLLSCWWVGSQVFQGFFDEFWDWWWLRKMLSVKEVCKKLIVF